MFIFGSRIIEAGGIEYIETVGASFELLFDIAEAIDIGLPIVTFVYVIFVLLFVHIIAFVIGSIVGWISFAGKASGGAKFAATLYLIGALCFPIYIFFALPIAIIGFVGGGKQKRINKSI